MPIEIKCECGRRLQARDEDAGQQGECPTCQRVFTIPDTREPLPPLALPAEPPPVVEAVPEEEAPPLTDHGGLPLPKDVDFFVPPPTEIGPLVTAYTTLRTGKNPRSVGGRLLLTLLVAGPLTLGATVLLAAGEAPPVAWVVVLLPTLGLSTLLGLYLTRFRHSCTYVGRLGTAKFVCKGDRDRLIKAEVFRFAAADELRTSQTSQYVNGVYSGTDYGFTWTAEGQTCYKLSGRYHSSDGNPKSTDPFHFARSAEVAWTIYLLQQVPRQLEASGSVRFNLRRGHWVRLGPAGLRFAQGGEVVEWPVEDIGGANVNQGTVQVTRRDAKFGWFKNEGVLSFSYSDLGNAMLFFQVFGRLYGG